MNKLNDAEFVQRSIRIDAQMDDYLWDEDEAVDGTPVTRLNFRIAGAIGLIEIVDSIREEKGFLPVLPTEKHSEEYDFDGWYDFYVDLNDYQYPYINDNIYVVVQSDNAPDDFCNYEIEMDKEAQILVFEEMDKECKKAYGKSARELLNVV